MKLLQVPLLLCNVGNGVINTLSGKIYFWTCSCLTFTEKVVSQKSLMEKKAARFRGLFENCMTSGGNDFIKQLQIAELTLGSLVFHALDFRHLCMTVWSEEIEQLSLGRKGPSIKS